MAMTKKDVLIAARALIDTPEKWTKGAQARDKSGSGVMPTDQSAVCYCATGALLYVARDHQIVGGDAWDLLLDILSQDESMIGMSALSIETWNDRWDRNHAEVLALFDKAIANA